MPIAAAPVGHLVQRSRVSVLRRSLIDVVLSSLGHSPQMGKTEEVERRRLRGGVSFSVRALEAEVDALRLLRMQHEAILRQPLTEHALNPIAVEKVFEHHHEV